jgi:hypothetical protein
MCTRQSFLYSAPYTYSNRPYLLYKYTEGSCWISPTCGRIMYGYPLSQQIFSFLHQTRRIVEVSSLARNNLIKTSVLDMTPHQLLNTVVTEGLQLIGTNKTIPSTESVLNVQHIFGSKNLWNTNNKNTKYSRIRIKSPHIRSFLL